MRLKDSLLPVIRHPYVTNIIMLAYPKDDHMHMTELHTLQIFHDQIKVSLPDINERIALNCLAFKGAILQPY